MALTCHIGPRNKRDMSIRSEDLKKTDRQGARVDIATLQSPLLDKLLATGIEHVETRNAFAKFRLHLRSQSAEG